MVIQLSAVLMGTATAGGVNLASLIASLGNNPVLAVILIVALLLALAMFLNTVRLGIEHGRDVSTVIDLKGIKFDVKSGDVRSPSVKRLCSMQLSKRSRRRKGKSNKS